MYLDPDEREDPVKADITPSIVREFVKARVVGKSVVISLPPNLRDPLGIHPGSKLMVTLDLENKRLIITKE